MIKTTKFLTIPLTFLMIVFFITPKVNAISLVRPSGMILKDSSGRYYYTYYPPGSNYTGPRLKYIGHGEVLSYYLNRGRSVQNISDSEKISYTIHNHNLSFPCGETARDNDGRIAFYEPLGWPPGAQDQGDTTFSYTENFPRYVSWVNWSYTYRTGTHYQDILRENAYNQISIIDGLPENGIESGIWPYGIPNCVIVKQINSNDFYRVFRHRTQIGLNIERKAKIQTPEMLDLWLNYNSYFYEADITALPNIGSAKMPPGLLVRTLDNTNVYFTDDEGQKVYIPNITKFTELGFKPNSIKFVLQSTLNTTPTKYVYGGGGK